MSRVLLLSPRAPVTLEMARHLARASHEVHVAESRAIHLCTASRAVTKSHRVPRPRQDHAAWVDALLRIVVDEQIDLVIPTCEEVFWLSLARDRLSAHTRVLVESFETLMLLHDKARFVAHARALGFDVPETEVVNDAPSLRSVAESWGRDIVVKPVFSRFASRVLIRPTARALSRVHVDERAPHVVQRFVPGRQLSTYSVAHSGRLALHATYAGPWRAGKGASVAFDAIDHEGARAFASRVVESLGFTGQIAFDFIARDDGALAPIECNPRATSGLHLFPHDGRAAHALTRSQVDDDAAPVSPDARARAQLTGAVLLYGPLGLRSLRDAGRLLRDAFLVRDVLFDRADPAAIAVQALASIGVAFDAIRHRTGLLAATTVDIEHNGPLAEGTPERASLPPPTADDAGARHAA